MSEYNETDRSKAVCFVIVLRFSGKVVLRVIMSILLEVDKADFVYLKAETGATSGNLSVQIDSLQDRGRDAFAAYVDALCSYIPSR